VAKNAEPEMTALQTVHSALKALDKDAQTKVIAAVSALLELSPIAGTSEAGARLVTPQGSGQGEQQARSARPKSLVEVIQERNPKTIPEYITLFAYHRDKHEGMPRFARSDLRPYFGRAREDPPGNFDRDFNKAVSYGWIHEDNGDSYVTSKGIETVEGGFSADQRQVRRTKRSRRARTGAKKRPVSKRKPVKRVPARKR
jgi:hypothetical protein